AQALELVEPVLGRPAVGEAAQGLDAGKAPGVEVDDRLVDEPEVGVCGRPCPVQCRHVSASSLRYAHSKPLRRETQSPRSVVGGWAVLSTPKLTVRQILRSAGGL